MAVKPIPDGYHTVTPYMIVKGAAKALEFYKQAFGATEVMRMAGPGGTIGHAEIKIGDSPIMLGRRVSRRWGAAARSRSAARRSASACTCRTCDALFNRAVAAGREGGAAGPGPVLRRPLRHGDRPVRPQVDDRHAHRGRVARGDAAADGRGDEADGRLLTARSPTHHSPPGPSHLGGDDVHAPHGRQVAVLQHRSSRCCSSIAAAVRMPCFASVVADLVVEHGHVLDHQLRPTGTRTSSAFTCRKPAVFHRRGRASPRPPARCGGRGTAR